MEDLDECFELGLSPARLGVLNIRFICRAASLAIQTSTRNTWSKVLLQWAGSLGLNDPIG